MKKQITWEKRPIAELIFPEWNPRQIKDKQFKELKESIKNDPEFLEVRPVIVSMRTGKPTIIAGNMRAKAAQSLGFTEIPTVSVVLTEEKEKEWGLKDNLHRGEWDWDALANQFDLDFLKTVGFDEKDLDKLLGMKERNDDDFELEEELEATTGRAKAGELWELGTHRLYVGDSCDPKSYQALFKGNKPADMVFTDPPYNIAYEGGMNTHGQNKRKMIKNDKMGRDEFASFLKNFIDSAMKYARGCWYICMSSKELDTLKIQFESAGGHWQSFIIWVKNTFTLSRSDWQNQYEPILYGWNGDLKNHYFVGWRDEANVWEDITKIKPIFDGEKTTIKLGEYQVELNGKISGRIIRKKEQTDIWREKKPTKSSDHPTMKPIALVERAIIASSKTGDVVLDPFLGSGTTMMACENTKRTCYGIELDEKYAEVIIRRWEEKTGNKAKKISS